MRLQLWHQLSLLLLQRQLPLLPEVDVDSVEAAAEAAVLVRTDGIF